MLCNALVCLAVWLTYSARSVTDKILAILFPITAFVAAGFEHSVANMYFLPMGVLDPRPAPAAFWRVQRCRAGDYPDLTLANASFDEPDPRDDRQRHRRLGDGRPRVLGHLRSGARMT